MRVAPERNRDRGISDEEINVKTLDSRLKLAATQNKNREEEKADEKDSLIESIRLETKKFMTTSWFGRTYDKIMLVLSILSCFEFIYQTYLDPVLDYQLLVTINYVELLVASLFACDWALSFFLADHKYFFVFSFYSMVDLLTVVPIYVTYNYRRPNLFEIKTSWDGFLYALFLLNTTRILRALRIRKYFFLIEDAVNRCLGEISLTIAVMLLFNTAVIQYLELEIQPFTFHHWVFFIWVTITTVGYGDISAQTELGRLFAMAMIGFAIIRVPQMTNELIEKMQMQSIYARAHYRPKNKRSTHVLICGDIKSTSLAEFFDELFHEDHQNEDIHAVLLLPDPPSKDLQTWLQDPNFALKVTYLQGSALVDKNLSRAMAETAVAVFVMTNKFSSKPDEEDAKTILQQFSIKRYIANRSVAMRTMFCIQLVRPENRRHLVDTTIDDDLDVVACMNEIKMGVIAKAVMAPGTSTLIVNLLTSFAEDPEEKRAIIGEIDQLEDEAQGNWISEYRQGCDWEIYTTELSEHFVGWKFMNLSDYLYERMGVVLFGLHAEETRQNKTYKRTLLNPSDYRIPASKDVKLLAFVMAKNKEQSDLTFGGGQVRTKPNEPTDAAATDSRPRSATTDMTAPGSPIGEIDNILQDALRGAEMTGTHTSSSEKKLYPWQELYRKYGDSRPDAFTHQEAIQKAEDHHLRENYYIRPVPADLADVTIKTSVMEEFPIMSNLNNHMIIMGKSLNNLYDLIRPLRAKCLGSLKFIVILYAEQIPHSVWQRISIFEGILVVRGSSLEEADMRRAGIFQAQKVIVLADAEDSSTSSIASGNLESLVDADAIFSYQCVRRMNEHAQVVVEIVRQSSIGYLDLEKSLKSTEVDYKFTPQFASGALFTSSLLDTIVCQSFYNPLIIKVINKMVSGEEHKETSELAMAGMVKSKGIMSVSASSLFQISIPDDLESRTYGALFKHLSKHDMLPLGIFRGTFRERKTGPKSNTMPYVFTNPPKDTELFSCDRVFVLAKKPPVGERKKAEQVKEIQLYEAVRRRKNVVDSTAENVTEIRNVMDQLKSRQNIIETQVVDFDDEMDGQLETLKQLIQDIRVAKNEGPSLEQTAAKLTAIHKQSTRPPRETWAPNAPSNSVPGPSSSHVSTKNAQAQSTQPILQVSVSRTSSPARTLASRTISAPVTPLNNNGASPLRLRGVTNRSVSPLVSRVAQPRGRSPN